MKAILYLAYLLVAIAGYYSKGTRLEKLLVKPVLYILLYGIIPLAVARAYALHGLQAFTRYSLTALTAFAATTPYAMLAASRLCRGDERCKSVVLLTMLFANTVFLPLSLASLQNLDIDVIMSYSLPLTLLHFTLGYRLGGASSRRDVPLLVTSSAITGLLLNITGLTSTILEPLRIIDMVSRTSGYLALYVVGASMPRVSRAHLSDPLVYYTFAWRSTGSILVHYTIAHILGIHGIPLRTIITEAVMPPATMNAVIARHIGADYERAAVAILLLTPVCTAEAIVLLQVLSP